MFKKIIFLILIIFAIKGCTKDDICPEGTAVTANLVINFKDFANPLNSKDVVGLSIETDYDESIEVLSRTTTDSIVIPLNTSSDTTKYRFIRTTISTTNDTTINTDYITFIYQRKNGYVNRACGFKTEFVNLDFDLEDEGTENWIEQVTINRETVNDEDSAHVTILH